MIRTEFQDVAASLGLALDSEQVDAFERFEERLYAANETMNLTRVPREECLLRHFVDSLLVAEFLREGATVLDIGTGPGFPAWPLACARPDLQVTAVDSSGKMLGFLNANPLPNLTVVQTRAEEWDVREAFDVVTGRAVAPLAAQLEISAPPCKVGGAVIPMRTPNDEAQCSAAQPLGLELRRTERRPLPGTDAIRVFPIFEKRRPTPNRYPRRWAEIKSRSL